MGFDDLMSQVDRAVLGSKLGDPVTYTPGVGAPVTVNGCFDRLYERVAGDASYAGVSSFGPAVFLRLADLPSDPVVDASVTVTIRGVVYKPRQVEPDGQGGVLLMLHLV